MVDVLISTEQDNPASWPSVAMCAGEDCRKRCELVKLRAALDAECEVIELKCVGNCRGPVIVAPPASKCPLDSARVRTKQQPRSA